MDKTCNICILILRGTSPGSNSPGKPGQYGSRRVRPVYKYGTTRGGRYLHPKWGKVVWKPAQFLSHTNMFTFPREGVTAGKRWIANGKQVAKQYLLETSAKVVWVLGSPWLTQRVDPTGGGRGVRRTNRFFCPFFVGHCAGSGRLWGKVVDLWLTRH